eukprot:1378265-Alexandrium_andersonii.AAC.1
MAVRSAGARVLGRQSWLALALELVVLAPARAARSPPAILASEARALQHLGGRTRPMSGRPRQGAPGAHRRGLGDPRPKATH